MSWQAQKIRKPPEHWSPNKLRKEAKKQFNAMVRAKYSDRRGMLKCVTCGKELLWSHKGTHAGHWRPGNRVMFVEMNVHPQCFRCNEILSSNSSAYDSFMSDTYGEHVMDWIRQLEAQGSAPTRLELLLIRSTAKMRYEGYVQEKGLK